MPPKLGEKFDVQLTMVLRPLRFYYIMFKISRYSDY